MAVDIIRKDFSCDEMHLYRKRFKLISTKTDVCVAYYTMVMIANCVGFITKCSWLFYQILKIAVAMNNRSPVASHAARPTIYK